MQLIVPELAASTYFRDAIANKKACPLRGIAPPANGSGCSTSAQACQHPKARQSSVLSAVVVLCTQGGDHVTSRLKDVSSRQQPGPKCGPGLYISRDNVSLSLDLGFTTVTGYREQLLPPRPTKCAPMARTVYSGRAAEGVVSQLAQRMVGCS